MSADDRNVLVDQRYVAERLGCSTRTLNRMVKTGRFPEPIRFLENGFPRWPLAALDDWFEAKRRQCAPPPPAPKRRGRPPGTGWKRQP